MKGIFPVERFQNVETPFYYYNADLLRETLNVIRTEAGKYNKFCVHYAIKANANPKILGIIRESGLGVDCVSGWEIEAAIQAGFPASKIVFAGLATGKNKIARVAFRINPDVGAHTHANITTGLAENKFGISMQDMNKVIDRALEMSHVKFVGLHFHIGSQILDMGDFIALCNRVNELQEKLYARQIIVEHINVGGGLGIDYAHPNRQTLHFELGRSVVGQCGSLITRVIYVKQGTNKQFAIADAGMTDLIRPALYQAYHKIENISSEEPVETYDVVGPICESSDVFGKAIDLNRTHRGDFLAIRSAGAYGEIMASGYNCRPLPKGYTSDELR